MSVVSDFLDGRNGKWNGLNPSIRIIPTPISRPFFYFSIFWPVVEVLSSVAMALVIWYGGCARAEWWSNVWRAAGLHPVRSFIFHADSGTFPINSIRFRVRLLHRSEYLTSWTRKIKSKVLPTRQHFQIHAEKSSLEMYGSAMPDRRIMCSGMYPSCLNRGSPWLL